MTPSLMCEIRDSKQTQPGLAQPTIVLPSQSFRELLDELDGKRPSGLNEHVEILSHPNGDTTFRSRSTGVELRYDISEIEIFVTSANEFTVA